MTETPTVPDPASLDNPATEPGAGIVDTIALVRFLEATSTSQWARERADLAAWSAGVFVLAYCTRLKPGDRLPTVVRYVALHFAARLARNPFAIRQVSAEGQSTDMPLAQLTYWEQTMLAPYRRRTA